MIVRRKGERSTEYLGSQYQSSNFIPFHLCQMLLYHHVGSNKYSCGWKDSTFFFSSTFGNNFHFGCLKNCSSLLVFRCIILILSKLFWVKQLIGTVLQS